MSDEIDDGGELSVEAKAFLARHAATGEPSTEALERVRQQLSAPSPEAPARRSFLRSEVMAAAAVVILLLGAQGLYLALRAPVEEVKLDGSDREVKAIAEAWSAGDFERVRRLASQECSSATCRPLASELAKMLGLVQHVETLSEAERDQLATFDKKLTGKTLSKVAIQLLKLQAPGAPSPAAVQLFEEALVEKKAKNLERAALRLEQCIDIAPLHSPCYRLLGSVYASIATRDQSASDMEKAREYYELFVQVADADDEYLPKVQAILDAARNQAPPPPHPDGELVGPIPLPLGRGDSTTITLGREFSRFAVDAPLVAEVERTGPRELRVKALSPGRTTLMIWLEGSGRQSFTIEVSGPTDPAEGLIAMEPPENGVVLSQGVQRELSMGGDIQRVAVGDPSIVDVKVIGGGKLLLIGLGKGKTTVLTWLSNGQRVASLVEVVSSEGHKRQQSRELYLRGYQLRDADPQEAIRLFKEVLRLTPPDDETHQKAKSRIRELEE